MHHSVLAGRWRSVIPVVFLISVLGVLFAWPLRAATPHEPALFRVEIDLSSPREWTIRATGPVRVGVNGQFIWPFRQEGFSPARITSFSHRPAGGLVPARHVMPESASPMLPPSPASLGYAPGDLVEIGLVRQVAALAGEGIDLALVMPRGGRETRVMVELLALRPPVRFRRAGLLSRGETLDPRGDRQSFEADMQRSSASALHEFSTEPRLFLSSHENYRELGAPWASLQ